MGWNKYGWKERSTKNNLSNSSIKISHRQEISVTSYYVVTKMILSDDCKKKKKNWYYQKLKQHRCINFDNLDFSPKLFCLRKYFAPRKKIYINYIS